jgi:hypothetical protein
MNLTIIVISFLLSTLFSLYTGSVVIFAIPFNLSLIYLTKMYMKRKKVNEK